MDSTTPHPIEVLHSSAQLQGNRPRQEDTIAATDGPNGPFIVVADGLGGVPGGDWASRIAVNFVMNQSRIMDPQPGNAPDLLKETIVAADEHFIAKARFSYAPATTLIIAYFEHRSRTLTTASVGDSLAFRVRDGNIRSLLPREGEKHGEDGLYEYGRRLLNSAVGWNVRRRPEFAVEISGPLEIEAGDRFVFATDGIESVPIDDLAKCLSLPTARDAAEAMTRLFLDARVNNQDNVSFIVAYVEPL